MFDKILIANRGEIACRIIKTAKRLGIQTVAVYSDADKNSLYVTDSDQSFHIGPSPSTESYLQIDNIIKVAKESGAEAIHPGYGFLSENSEFAKKCNDAGLVFIGPPADSIEKMGKKDVAKRIMEDVGVPIIPGYHGESQDIEYLASVAEKIGYPILIKASTGGGGKGMRIVYSKDEFRDSINAVQRESQSSFGDQSCIIEKYLPKTRHIEVQIFGDNQGNYVHLFERDCSIQRRYQKVIEEAPAPGFSDELRRELGNIAIQVAKAVDYANAGTVEFIADISNGLTIDSIYFMEMNTRLQVEHPVTECITGQDLVEWQFKIAAGESIPLKQSEIRINGSAIEARIYAEDPSNNFLPSIGKLNHFDLPSEEIRVDTGVSQNDEISQFYDPMIAKVISHANTRDESVAQLNSALSKSLITGVKTNIPFIRKILNHNAFLSGEVETGIVDKNIEKLIEFQPPSAEIFAIAGLASCGLLGFSECNNPWKSIRGWRSWGKSKCSVKIQWNEVIRDLQIEIKNKDKFSVFDGENLTSIQLNGEFEDGYKLNINDSSEIVRVNCLNQKITVLNDGDSFEFLIPEIDYLEEVDTGEKNKITAQIPSVIKEIKVSENEQVEKGQKLLVLEAMKMEHSINSSRDGVVSEVCVDVGQQVKEFEVLVKFEEVNDASKS